MNLLDCVKGFALKNPHGFTLCLVTKKLIRFGVSVAYKDTQDSHTDEELSKAIEHAMQNEKKVGGWINEDNGKYYYDSVKVFKNFEMEKAKEFAKANEQIAIFDITNLKEIKL